MENTFKGGNHLQNYQSKETLSALMTINYPVVLLLVYREGGRENGEWAPPFSPIFCPVCLRLLSRRLQFGASIATRRIT